jgi:hypothetical protein
MNMTVTRALVELKLLDRYIRNRLKIKQSKMKIEEILLVDIHQQRYVRIL